MNTRHAAAAHVRLCGPCTVVSLLVSDHDLCTWFGGGGSEASSLALIRVCQVAVA
jgi:hypothetical protein